MPSTNLEQPPILLIDHQLRLRKYDGFCDFALNWYQDAETVYMVDGQNEPYDMEKLQRMYAYLDAHGECYFIEILQDDRFVPIGDVTFGKDDLPIVIGDKHFRGMGIGKRVLRFLIERAQSLGYDTLSVREIYDWNTVSRKCFEALGFFPCGKTERGSRYRLDL